MQTYRILREKTGARLELIPELENLLQYGGCSIRLTGTKGIRMVTALDKTAREALMGAGLAALPWRSTALSSPKNPAWVKMT